MNAFVIMIVMFVTTGSGSTATTSMTHEFHGTLGQCRQQVTQDIAHLRAGLPHYAMVDVNFSGACSSAGGDATNY